ncbi:MAG: hypothetical protein KIS78_12035 [Labilithrix sp.]|nr:hypothetical protein [Labilithrix sp.]
MTRTRRRLYLLAAWVVFVLAFAACTLNPQPLPPVDTGATDDGGSFSPSVPAEDASRNDDEGAARDAAAPPGEGDAGDAGDASDAGDAGDAGDTDDD